MHTNFWSPTDIANAALVLIFGSTLLQYKHYIRSVPYIQEHPFKNVHGWTFYLPYLSSHSLF